MNKKVVAGSDSPLPGASFVRVFPDAACSFTGRAIRRWPAVRLANEKKK